MPPLRGWMGRRPTPRKDNPVSTSAADETWTRLGAAVQLLHHAALKLWSHADQAPAAAAVHSLGLGVQLAHGRAAALLPREFELPEVEIDDRTALQMITAAEELTRGLPVRQPGSRIDVVDSSELVVDLCDLIREARGLDY